MELLELLTLAVVAVVVVGTELLPQRLAVQVLLFFVTLPYTQLQADQV
jgi:type IV secretory pathway VirB2 component (pilin)